MSVVVSITGHRNVTVEDTRTIRLAMTTLLANESVRAICFGGARGTDTEALKAALELRGQDRTPKLVVIVPNRVSDQPAQARVWIAKADQVIELGNPITVSDGFKSYDIRNRYLVEAARRADGFVVAFWNKKPSGTKNCIDYAGTVGVPVEEVYIDGDAS